MVRNKNIFNSWDKIKAGDAAHERMLGNILERVHSGKTKKGSELNMTVKPLLKVLAPIAACALIVLAVAIPLLMRNGAVYIPQINDGNISQTPSGVEREHPIYPLTFNTDGALLSASIDRRVSFFHDVVTGEQMGAVFPGLNLPLTVRALYLDDGSLIEVSAFEPESGVTIRLAEGSLVHTMLFYFDEPPQVSYVHGVPVTAAMSGDDDFAFYMADFMLGNIDYRVEMSGARADADRIVEIVNQLILGGPADLSVLADPVIPELRNEELTLAQAQDDPDFGAFLPVSVPSDFLFDHAWRVINQDFNGLFAFWHIGHASMDAIRWQVSKPTEHDLARIVSVDDREKFDLSLYPIPWMDSVPQELMDFVTNPVFLSDELTLEAVQARVLLDGRRDGAQMNFSVLYDDVIINLDVSGMTPEQVWEMLSQLR